LAVTTVSGPGICPAAMASIQPGQDSWSPGLGPHRPSSAPVCNFACERKLNWNAQKRSSLCAFCRSDRRRCHPPFAIRQV